MAESAADENAAERRFGPQFDNIHILSNAQVAVILQVSAGQAVTRDEELNDVYKKTQKYVERFNQMSNKEKDHQGKIGLLLRKTFLFPISFYAHPLSTSNTLSHSRIGGGIG